MGDARLCRSSADISFEKMSIKNHPSLFFIDKDIYLKGFGLHRKLRATAFYNSRFSSCFCVNNFMFECLCCDNVFPMFPLHSFFIIHTAPQFQLTLKTQGFSPNTGFAVFFAGGDFFSFAFMGVSQYMSWELENFKLINFDESHLKCF